MSAEQQPAQGGHGDGPDRVELDHRAEALAGADPEQHLMDQLRRLGHQPHGDAGAAADEGGQHDQPDFVGADQRAQRLRRVQHGVAERRGAGDGSGWTQFSRLAGLPERPRWLSRQEVSTCATSSGASEKKVHSWNLRAAGSTATMPFCHWVW